MNIQHNLYFCQATYTGVPKLEILAESMYHPSLISPSLGAVYTNLPSC